MTLLINNFETAYMNCPAAAVLAATKLQVSDINSFGYPGSCAERSVGEYLDLVSRAPCAVETCAELNRLFARLFCECSLCCSHAETGRATPSSAF